MAAPPRPPPPMRPPGRGPPVAQPPGGGGMEFDGGMSLDAVMNDKGEDVRLARQSKMIDKMKNRQSKIISDK